MGIKKEKGQEKKKTCRKCNLRTKWGYGMNEVNGATKQSATFERAKRMKRPNEVRRMIERSETSEWTKWMKRPNEVRGLIERSETWMSEANELTERSEIETCFP